MSGPEYKVSVQKMLADLTLEKKLDYYEVNSDLNSVPH